MRWNIIVECVGEDGEQSTITPGTIERRAGSTTAKNLGANLQESKRIVNHLQGTVVKQQVQGIVNKGENVSPVGGCGRLKTSAADGFDTVVLLIEIEPCRPAINERLASLLVCHLAVR
jgi:hypothetical protein